MLENVLSNYRNYIDARKGASDAYVEGLKEINKNFIGRTYESKLEALKTVYRYTITALEEEYINPIKNAFTNAKNEVRAVLTKPIPDDMQKSLMAFNGLKITNEEKRQILEMTKHNYLAKKRAVELLNVTDDKPNFSIDTVIADIEEIENYIVESINKSVDDYYSRLLYNGEWLNKVQEEAIAFCDTYGKNA